MITMRHRAWLACRSPPRLSRCRVTLPGGGGDRGDGAQVRPGGLGAQPPGVVPGRDQTAWRRCPGRRRRAEQSGCAGGHERCDQHVKPLELAVQELGAAAELAQGQQGVVADHAARAGPQCGQPGDQALPVLWLVNRARMSSGPVRISARAWLIVWVRWARAVRLATISARIASTAPSRPRGAPDARRTGRRGQH